MAELLWSRFYEKGSYALWYHRTDGTLEGVNILVRRWGPISLAYHTHHNTHSVSFGFGKSDYVPTTAMKTTSFGIFHPSKLQEHNLIDLDMGKLINKI